MTREEAIRKLQNQKAEYLERWVDFSGVAEAYDMAIEALKQPEILACGEGELNVPDTNVADCSDCIKHGGDWDCDHVHCHKGKLPSAQIKYTRYEESILTMLFRITKLIIDLQGGCMKIFDGQYFVDNNDLFNLAEKMGINY